jgi:hypothetical protein
MDKPPKTVRVRGRIASAVVRRGTASAHDAWVLESEKHGRLTLKRLGGNPYEKGPAPADPGCEVEAEGYLLGKELRYTSLRRL